MNGTKEHTEISREVAVCAAGFLRHLNNVAEVDKPEEGNPAYRYLRINAAGVKARRAGSWA